jgi:hypothetical protein
VVGRGFTGCLACQRASQALKDHVNECCKEDVLQLLTIAARSACPPPPAALTPPPRGAEGVTLARAPGTGGLPGAVAGGLAGTGLGLAATGGGLPPKELVGLGFTSERSSAEDVDGVFFHGLAVPFEGAIPGKTDTGFAEASAVTDWTTTFGGPDGVAGLMVGAAGIGRRA